MKATVCHRQNIVRHQPLPYPNAATRRQILQKFLDLLLVAACGMGMAAAVLLLLVVI